MKHEASSRQLRRGRRPVRVGEQRLRAHPVANRHHREVSAPGVAGLRVDAGRPAGAGAAAQIIQAYDEEPVGVDGLAGPDAGIPPAGALVALAGIAGGMVVAGQGMADQHRIGGVAVEGAIGLIDQLVGRQGTAAFQFESSIKLERSGLDQTYRVFSRPWSVVGDLLRHDDSLAKDAAKSKARPVAVQSATGRLAC